MLTVGLLINPAAGIGGTVGLKGSDGARIVAEARRRGGVPRGHYRARRALESAAAATRSVRWLTWGGGMGESLAAELGLEARVLGAPDSPDTSAAADTAMAARAIADAGADLLVFCGGDGTARDILRAIGQRLPVLGVPAGVKMHSGVFATTPERAGEILRRLVDGGLVQATEAEVRDQDEDALRAGELRPRYYGDLRVPELGGFLQHTKEGGRENEALAVGEIVAELVERCAELAGPVILGPGSTLAAIKSALGVEPTLVGFDVVWRGSVSVRDADAGDLVRVLDAAEAEGCRVTLVLSFTRQQGFLLGRGNQQLTPALLRRIGRERVRVVGTRSKLLSLDGRPLLMDSDDPALDRQWAGLIEIISGYRDSVWYRLDHQG